MALSFYRSFKNKTIVKRATKADPYAQKLYVGCFKEVHFIPLDQNDLCSINDIQVIPST